MPTTFAACNAARAFYLRLRELCPEEKRRERKEQRKKWRRTDKRKNRTRPYCRQPGCETYAQRRWWCNGYCTKHAGDPPVEEKLRSHKKRLSAGDTEEDSDSWSLLTLLVRRETAGDLWGRSRKVADGSKKRVSKKVYGKLKKRPERPGVKRAVVPVGLASLGAPPRRQRLDGQSHGSSEFEGTSGM